MEKCEREQRDFLLRNLEEVDVMKAVRRSKLGIAM